MLFLSPPLVLQATCSTKLMPRCRASISSSRRADASHGCDYFRPQTRRASLVAAPLGDQSQRALRHHALIVEPAPPADWCDVAVLMRERVAREGEFLAERCPRVGV